MEGFVTSSTNIYKFVSFYSKIHPNFFGCKKMYILIAVSHTTTTILTNLSSSYSPPSLPLSVDVCVCIECTLAILICHYVCKYGLILVYYIIFMVKIKENYTLKTGFFSYAYAHTHTCTFALYFCGCHH